MTKKLFLILICMWVVQRTFSQISYEFSDFAIAGDNYVVNSKYYLPSDSVLINQFDESWDFSSIQSDSTDTIKFILPSETQFADSFLTANLTMIDADGAMLFLKSTETGVQLLGLAADYAGFGIPFSYAIDNEFYLAKFPVNVNDELNNSTSFTITESLENLGVDPDSLGLPVGVDSVRLKVTLTDESQINDYGIVILPDKSYDCLKEDRLEIFTMEIEIQVFTLWIPVPDYSINDTTHSYRWLAKNTGYPVAEVLATPNDFVFAVKLLKSNTQAVEKIPLADKIIVYPNPANNVINVKSYNSATAFQITITDINGNSIIKYSQNTSRAEYDISSLSPGNYLLSIANRQNEIMQTIKFCVIH
ncbi:MAG: T9SS type A sorting domain-containing protein [Chlorobi bacterium]|nr:T9SS type A sorting domain-containing protein [Chlorobiota bacterium]